MLPLYLLWWPVTAEQVRLDQAIALVDEAWRRAVASGAMSEQSWVKFTGLLRRFSRYASAHGICELADVDAVLISGFIKARGRTRRGEVDEAAVATQRLRRSVLRAFFRTARQLLLTDSDPTRDIALPGRPARRIRPLNDGEAELCRYFARLTEGATRHATVLALALAGVHSAEVARVRGEDVDLEGGRVFTAGGTRTTARWCALDPWSVDCLRRRMRLLPAPSARLTGTGEGSPAQQQARVCVPLRDVLVRAGLGDDPSLRPASITAHAGWRVFRDSSRIEDAVRVLGAVAGPDGGTGRLRLAVPVRRSRVEARGVGGQQPGSAGGRGCPRQP